MMAPRITMQDIKAAIIGRLPQLVRELAPEGRRNGAYWIARNPTRDDRRAGSFWILLTGSAAGAWRDEATGDQGDAIDLIAYLTGGDRAAARAWAIAWLGWSGAAPPPRPRLRPAVGDRPEPTDDQKARKAFGWWLKAKARLEGTPVERYLARRGIALAALAHPPGAIRYLPRAQHVDADGVVTDWPAMMAAMSDAHGRVRAVHRTFLTDAGDKAPVEPVKKIWPSFKGCAIRLAKGKPALTPEEAARRGVAGPLVLTEGIEDGLTVALACPRLRVWAAGSLGNMAAVPLLPCVTELIICADNDDHEQARRQLDRVVAMLRQRGARVRIARAWTGKDVNDLVKGETT